MGSVDIIVPCYRYGHFLRECVESVLSQSLRSIRILIVNDASPDATAEVARGLATADSRVHCINHSTNKGHIYTYNEGIEWATADYILLLSADDYLLPGALARVVGLMDRHTDVGFAFGNAIEMDARGCKKATSCISCANNDRILSGADFMAASGGRNIVPTPTAVVRTALHKKVGGYRSELPHTGDLELWLRLAAHAPVGFVKSLQAVYRRHATNMSLSYAADHYLPDVEQRRAAVECFLKSCHHLVPDPTRLRRSLLRSVAIDAVGFASAAFNDGELELADALSGFAHHTDPTVGWSWAWAKLACKRGIGSATWNALRPAAHRARRLISLARASK